MQKNNYIASVIIVHWNTPDKLENLLAKLENSNDIEIIVVDNNSENNIDRIKKKYPSVVDIQNNVNRGYAFACNQGANIAKSDWLVFLNPDIEIETNGIKQLVHYAQTRKLDAVSPLPGSDSYKKPIPTSLSLITEFTPLKHIIPKGLLTKLSGGSTLFGGALCIKKNTLRKLKGWDERFFVWFEDSDLTRRLLQHSYKVGWAPIKIKHSGGASFEKLSEKAKKDMFFHAMNVYARKHFEGWGKRLILMLSKKYTPNTILPAMSKNISVTIPNMRKELLDSFLKENSDQLSKAEHPIIITSALDDAEIWTYRSNHPYIRFISIEENKGFTHTVNIGFRVSPTKWIATVNDDTTEAIVWMKQATDNAPNDTGSLNPVIYDNNENIESSGIKILKKGKALPIKTAQKEMYASVDANNAATVAYSHAGLLKTGLFDEKFGSYLEDIDLSLRLARMGFKNYVHTTSKACHIGQSTSKHNRLKKLFDVRNWIYVVIKNWSFRDLITNSPSILTERARNIYGIFKT